ncbi:PREDICTED: LRR receptor-like serine/threonine-protein kinase GSO2 [Populus euphratica]|uniref:LRR receptor-like serine/threonine-protein kinase GSO2 n=1 Tax=Populus euphratica TaxID=75702 RepID=A0AAJ6Y7G9_POPEU|nr:PREDICTED: LRR receptor-like serine/threonine-protein kinase GSO2 [Populus euphratica]
MMMKRMGAWMLLALLTLVGEWHGRCYGCLQEERIGLLEIQSLVDPYGVYLRDWVDSSNCCEWPRIECDNTTRRVVRLSLGGAWDFRLGDWVLNGSLFLPFKELQSLELRWTGLVGCLENEGFEVLSSKLRELGLSDNGFNKNDKSILSCFNGNLSTLESLDLSGNRLTAGSGGSFYGLEVLSSRLKKLENLDLWGNQCNDSILPSLTGFSSLKSLDLSYNELTGSGLEVLSSRLKKLQNLHLGSNQYDDSILPSLTGFSSLKSLDLSYNELTGSGLEVLSSRLKKLENLDLGWNQYNDSIFPSLTGFSSLKSLDLSYNELTGSGIIHSFEIISSHLGKLENLDLSYNNRFNDSVLSHLRGLSSLKSLNLSGNMLLGSPPTVNGTFFNSSTLEELHLDYTSLPINFLQNIGALPALKVLSVAECDLHGTLPAQGWCELKNLKQLDLARNNFGGSLPDCLGNLSSLQLLDVSDNQFTGNIASSPLTNLISLEFLSLSNNLFEVSASMKPLMNHSSLKFFSSENNRLVTEPAAFDNLIPKFQLVFFCLSSNPTSEALNVEIPDFLYYQYDLRVLDLSHNNITGMFPSWLLKNNTRMEQLYLSENSFVGTLQLLDHPYPNMAELDISTNNMNGQIPKDICLIFPNMWILMMAKNEFTGYIPSCLGNISSLSFLDLSNNQLSTVKLEQLTTIEVLKLSNNNLGGQLPTSVFNSSGLSSLYLSHNNFWGQISDIPLCGWKEWNVLDLSNNQFSGMFQGASLILRDLEQLIFPKTILRVRFQETFVSLTSLNIWTFLRTTCLEICHLVSMHHKYSSLVTMDLRDNTFTSSIPNWIGNLSSLSVLLLRDNIFDGELPVQLCLLEHLSILDVSQNQLSGPLPTCLGNLTFKESSHKAIVDFQYRFGSTSIEKAYYETMGPPLVGSMYSLERGFLLNFTEEVTEFRTKNMYYEYKGKVLSYMSGIDLSNNNFIGAIPPEFGNLSKILSLNLSHNNFTGSIPATFSNLKHIESLDLSYNNLNGVIPPQLTEITTLEVFSVAHNNLSGRTPERKYQFGTFDDENSYEGNPFLCGPPLRNNCSEEAEPSQPVPNDEQGDDGFIDMEFFYISFSVCYIVVVMTIAAVLYINPHWRHRWLFFIEDCIDTCYYFVVDSFRKFSNFRR